MAVVAPQPKFTAYKVDADGYVIPLVGGKLYSYIPGTTTPKSTYTDATLGTANTNPKILDANGQADVWFDGATKLILKDSADVTLWSVDAMADPSKNGVFTDATLSGSLTVSSASITWSGNPTHSGNHTFSNNVTINGNTTLGNASNDTLTIAPNAVTWSNNPTHSGNHTWSGTQTFNAAPAGNVLGSTYTPTLSNTTGISASTVVHANYIRIGTKTLVSGVVEITASATNATCELRLTLPPVNGLTTNTQLSGGAQRHKMVAGALSAYVIGRCGVLAVPTDIDRARLLFFNDTDTTAQNWSFWFMY